MILSSVIDVNFTDVPISLKVFVYLVSRHTRWESSDLELYECKCGPMASTSLAVPDTIDVI